VDGTIQGKRWRNTTGPLTGIPCLRFLRTTEALYKVSDALVISSTRTAHTDCGLSAASAKARYTHQMWLDCISWKRAFYAECGVMCLDRRLSTCGPHISLIDEHTTTRRPACNYHGFDAYEAKPWVHWNGMFLNFWGRADGGYPGIGGVLDYLPRRTTRQLRRSSPRLQKLAAGVLRFKTPKTGLGGRSWML